MKPKSKYYDLMFIGCGGDIRATKEYSTYCGMIQRCKSSKPAYRDVYVDEYFLDKIEGFRRFLDDVGIANSSMSDLDRVDNSLGYVRGNLRWTTREINLSNRSVTLRVRLASGEEVPLVKWCDDNGRNYLNLKQKYSRRKVKIMLEAEL